MASNYGWQFYKNYYKGIENFELKEKYSDAEKKQQMAFFETKNNAFKNISALDKTHFYTGTHSFPLVTTYPGLILGTGYGHETGLQGEMKLGFFFDHATGLPIIPGSSVKGKLRSVFPHFKTKPNKPLVIEENDNHFELKKQKAKYIRIFLGKDDSWTDLSVHKFELAIFEGLDILMSNGKDTPQYLPMRQHDVFHDAFVSHISKTLFEFDAITPHGKNPLKNPIPIAFLKIAPNVTFQFNFDLKSNYEVINPALKIDLFTKILEQQGIGAKTNVGYGQFQ